MNQWDDGGTSEIPSLYSRSTLHTLTKAMITSLTVVNHGARALQVSVLASIAARFCVAEWGSEGSQANVSIGMEAFDYAYKSTGMAVFDYEHQLNEAAAAECDESLCQNQYEHFPGIYAYHCWSHVGREGSGFAEEELACAEEYRGYPVPNVTRYGTNGTLEQYYTCCPEGYTGPIARECDPSLCSSPAGARTTDCWTDAAFEPMTCSLGTFPRMIGVHSTSSDLIGTFSQYTCCKTSDGTPPLPHTVMVLESIRLALACVAVVLCIIFVSAIVLTPETRSQSLNLYVVYLSIADGVGNIVVAVTSTLVLRSVPVGSASSRFFENFHATANLWINAAIAHSLYTLLRNSNQRKRTQPPSVTRITIEAFAAYAFACLMGVWNIYLLSDIGWHTSFHYWNIALNHSEQLAKFVLALGLFLMAFFPLTYMAYIIFRVKKDKLLPKSERTRSIALYFLRLQVIFFSFWVPALAHSYIALSRGGNVESAYTFWYLIISQTFVSLAFAAQKPDIKKALLNFLACNYRGEEQTGASWVAKIRMKFSTKSTLVLSNEEQGGDSSPEIL